MVTIENIVELVLAEYGIGLFQLSNNSNFHCMDARCMAVRLCYSYEKKNVAIRDQLNISLDQIKYADNRFVNRSVSDARFYARFMLMVDKLNKKEV